MAYGDKQLADILDFEVITITSGTPQVIDMRGKNRLTVITATGTTATVSRVDNLDASSDTSGSENTQTVSANTALVLDTDWPFYRISVPSGSCRVAVL